MPPNSIQQHPDELYGGPGYPWDSLGPCQPFNGITLKSVKGHAGPRKIEYPFGIQNCCWLIPFHTWTKACPPIPCFDLPDCTWLVPAATLIALVPLGWDIGLRMGLLLFVLANLHLRQLTTTFDNGSQNLLLLVPCSIWGINELIHIYVLNSLTPLHRIRLFLDFFKEIWGEFSFLSCVGRILWGFQGSWYWLKIMFQGIWRPGNNIVQFLSQLPYRSMVTLHVPDVLLICGYRKFRAQTYAVFQCWYSCASGEAVTEASSR